MGTWIWLLIYIYFVLNLTHPPKTQTLKGYCTNLCLCACARILLTFRYEKETARGETIEQEFSPAMYRIHSAQESQWKSPFCVAPKPAKARYPWPGSVCAWSVLCLGPIDGNASRLEQWLNNRVRVDDRFSLEDKYCLVHNIMMDSAVV